MVVLYVVALTSFTRKLQKFVASLTIKLPPAQVFVASKERSPFAPPVNEYELARYNHLRYTELQLAKEKRSQEQTQTSNATDSPTPDGIMRESNEDWLTSTDSGKNVQTVSPAKKRPPSGASKSSRSGKIGLPRYRILVHVFRANNLIPTDKNGTHAYSNARLNTFLKLLLPGKSDPKIKLRVGQHKAKTKCVSNTLNPEFDQKLSLKVIEPDREKLSIRVFSKKKPQVRSNLFTARLMRIWKDLLSF